MTRGKLDLGTHKLAGLYRPQAQRNRWRPRREKCPDEQYRLLWSLVSGAVRDTFANHPEYLTPAGERAAERSICKRVTGTLHGFAAQVARGRSVASGDTPANAAAVAVTSSPKVGGWTGWFTTARPWRAFKGRAWGCTVGASPKFTGGNDG